METSDGITGLSAAEIHEKIFEDLSFLITPEKIQNRSMENFPCVEIYPDSLQIAVKFLKESYSADFLDSISAADLLDYSGILLEKAPLNSLATEGGRFILLHYLLHSYRYKQDYNLKIFLRFDELKIESIDDLFGNANWLEREIYDLFGVVFTGSRDLRRLLLPEDWKGYPLRKDFAEESIYQGMPTTRASILDEKTEKSKSDTKNWIMEESGQ